ncbi:WYL domain-containing protein [Serratia sp. JSRIV001]|uniref:DeoR family transcriptional regulator n=1 Tax=unclassified Serratia (in: enterobacteria) TaxID=2647522 RepID=UPI001CBB4CE6|nr:MULTISPECIES: WYL domain-containing protein [unclassified Serratia (in: enterobacteria)]UAN43969.1 WYL domain-containing protein [Serratia sp. JSRIV001]UAN53519.1 WYL domain-containing protein [Serratia sp. JSRIV002]UAN58140.1 WYL domain-containing protein [Serratia sp. JSRIV004]
MPQIAPRHDRLAVRLSLIISRLLAGDTLNVRNLASEFGVSLRTLRRDFRERLVYLDLEYQQGLCRLASGVSQRHTEKDVLAFARRIGIIDLLPGLDSQMIKALLSADGASPCISWPTIFQLHHASQVSAHFATLVDTIATRHRVLLLTPTCRYERLAPYRLMFHDGHWYLVGEWQGRIAVIVVDDIDAVIVSKESYVPCQAVDSLITHTHFVAALPHYRFIREVLLPFHSPPNE